MRRIRSSLRKVLPPGFVTATVLGSFAFLFALLWLLGPDRGPHELREVWSVTIACLFGLWRAFGLARLKTSYGAWLENTPWAPGDPLPMGPIRLAWQDVVLVGALAALVYDSPKALLHVPQAFLLSYVTVLGIVFFFTKTRWSGYLIVFGLGLWGLQADPASGLLVAIGLAFVSQFGLRRALGRFPWKDEAATSSPIDLAGIYPFHHLRYDDTDKPLHWFEGLTISALAGWIVYVCGQDAGTEVMSFTIVAILGVSAVRLCRYTNQSAAPISVLGRLRTLRLVIPSYDKVLVAPLAILAATPTVMAIASELGASRALIAALGVGTMLLIALNMGPTLRDWRLTGGQRIHVPEQVVAGRQT